MRYCCLESDLTLILSLSTVVAAESPNSRALELTKLCANEKIFVAGLVHFIQVDAYGRRLDRGVKPVRVSASVIEYRDVGPSKTVVPCNADGEAVSNSDWQGFGLEVTTASKSISV